MKVFLLPLTATAIASQVPGQFIERHKGQLRNVAELSEANNESICFFENETYIEDLKGCKAGFLFVKEGFDAALAPEANLLYVDKPYLAFMMLVKTWLQLQGNKESGSIAPSAVIDATATIGPEVRIGANVVIGKNCRIGKGSVIDANTVLGEEVVIGEYCHLFPNTTIYEGCELGNRVILHAGVVIGADGFGYLLHEGIQNKVPQIGIVVIGDDVEIGANSCIDRATIGKTIIGNDTKIDNLVQIGHNVKIGSHSMICAHVGLAGSCIVGDYVYLAGQVGVADHTAIGNGVVAGGQSGLSGKIADGSKLFGSPAMEANLAKKVLLAQRRLPDLVHWMNRETKKKSET